MCPAAFDLCMFVPLREPLAEVKVRAEQAVTHLVLSKTTIPEWEKRLRLLVIGFTKPRDISTTPSAKLLFEECNELLKCLYPRVEGYHVDFYLDIIGTISSNLEHISRLVSGASAILVYQEDVHYVGQINALREGQGLSGIPARILDIPSGSIATSSSPTHPEVSMVKYYGVAVGGTFDHLHSGHKILLKMAAGIAENVLVCGVTAASLQYGKKYGEVLQSLDVRVGSVREYLETISPADLKINIVVLNDVYGPTINDDRLGAIVATEETIEGCRKINRYRSSVNMKELDIFIADLWGEPLNHEFTKFGSTALRKAIMERKANGDAMNIPGSTRS